MVLECKQRVYFLSTFESNILLPSRYLVAGMVARNIAGPGVVFSFIIAAVASIFSGNF